MQIKKSLTSTYLTYMLSIKEKNGNIGNIYTGILPYFFHFRIEFGSLTLELKP